MNEKIAPFKNTIPLGLGCKDHDQLRKVTGYSFFHGDDPCMSVKAEVKMKEGLE